MEQTIGPRAAISFCISAIALGSLVVAPNDEALT
jgi:hypothetical protein